MSSLFLVPLFLQGPQHRSVTELKKFTPIRAPHGEAAAIIPALINGSHHRGIQSAYGAPRLGAAGAAAAAAAAAARSAAPYAHRSAAADADCTTGAT